MPTFTGSKGCIHHQAWLPDGQARAVVVLLHGYGEHLGLYDTLARRLTSTGHAVHALDCVGHGRSDGERGRIDTWDDYVADARTLVGIASDQHPGAPIVLVGHSGGGLAAFLLAVRHPQLVSAAVLSGAPLAPLDWVTDELAGQDPEAGDLDPTTMLSTHPDYIHALMHDPLCLQGGFHQATLRAVQATTPEVGAALAEGRPVLPVLLLHGEDDPVVPVSVARSVAAALPHATLRVFPGDLHDVLNEHDREVVHDELVAFVESIAADVSVNGPSTAVPSTGGAATEILADRLFSSLLGTLDVLTVHIGDQFGLYSLLHGSGPLRVADVAQRSGMHPRYAREWLEQQAVAGLVDVVDAAAAADERRYALSDAHAAVLCDPQSLAFLTPFARMLAAAAGQLPRLLEAYRTGAGVGWSDFGELMRTAQADANRPLFLGVLGSVWLPSLPEVDAVLRDGGKVADIGCGDGWSSIGIAQAYPAVTVDGYDVDSDSISAARDHAASYGLGDRVRFTQVDAASVPTSGDYDLVAAFECIHDLPDPVGVLRAARRMVRPGGTVLVMDERVPDDFTGPGDPVEQLMYGISLLICLPDGLSHPHSVGTGTVMRRDTLRAYARDAGFDDVEVLPVEHEMFRFYRLVG